MICFLIFTHVNGKKKKSLVDLRKIPKYHVLQDGDKVQIIDYHDT